MTPRGLALLLLLAASGSAIASAAAAPNLLVDVSPAAPLATPLTSVPILEVVYERSFGAFTSVRIDSFVFDSALVVQAGVEEYVNITSVTLIIREQSGVEIARKTVLPVPHATIVTASFAQWRLSEAEVALVPGPAQAPPVLVTVRRRARFMPIPNSDIDYQQTVLLVAPLWHDDVVGCDTTKSFFGATALNVSLSRPLTGNATDEIASLSGLSFSFVTINIDGEFSFQLARGESHVSDFKGWAWLLVSPFDAVAGFVADAQTSAGLSITNSTSVSDPLETTAVLLPVIGVNLGEGASTGSTDADEAEIVSNPALFVEEPGSNCDPFSNPARILGERAFFTIQRVTQPEIGSIGAGNGLDGIFGGVLAGVGHTLGAEYMRDIVSGVVGIGSNAQRKSVTSYAKAQLKHQTKAFQSDDSGALLLQTATDTEPTAVNAALLELTNTTENLRLLYGVLAGRTPVDYEHPINWEDDPVSMYQAATVAGGHILEYRVRWRSFGYSLGEVHHTMTLAPRQKLLIQKVDWERRQRESRDERQRVSDQVIQNTDHGKQFLATVQSTMHEWSVGASASVAASHTSGFSLFGLVGGGMSVSAASSTAAQYSGRNIAGSEQQSLRESLRQYAESLRQSESTIVVSAEESEAAQGYAEAIYNVNYCHSLTVMYHQIQRHMRVSTEIVGAREVIFVPFSVSEFDLDRIAKYERPIRRYLRNRDHRRALRLVDDVRTNFAASDIPNMRRAEMPILEMRGSVFVDLSIERPKDLSDGAFNPLTWNPIQRLLNSPAGAIFGTLGFVSPLLSDRLGRQQAARDDAFHRRVAPKIAREWLSKLVIEHGSSPTTTPLQGVEWTVRSAYRHGSTMRVDFEWWATGDELTRDALQWVRVVAGTELAENSIGDIVGMSLRYRTQHFSRLLQYGATSLPRGQAAASYKRMATAVKRAKMQKRRLGGLTARRHTYTVRASGVRQDLVDPDDGSIDPDGAILDYPLTRFENTNPRTEAIALVRHLREHMNEEQLYYHKAIWWSMNRDDMFMLLDGFNSHITQGRSLASVVSPHPIAIMGNSLVFRVNPGVFLGIGGHDTFGALQQFYADVRAKTEPMFLSLPTQGLYARTIMDKCNACEDHAGSTDWVFGVDEPELPSVPDLASRSNGASADLLKPSGLSDTSLASFGDVTLAEPTTIALGAALAKVSAKLTDLTGLSANQDIVNAATLASYDYLKKAVDPAAAVKALKFFSSSEGGAKIPKAGGDDAGGDDAGGDAPAPEVEEKATAGLFGVASELEASLTSTGAGESGVMRLADLARNIGAPNLANKRIGAVQSGVQRGLLDKSDAQNAAQDIIKQLVSGPASRGHGANMNKVAQAALDAGTLNYIRSSDGDGEVQLSTRRTSQA